MSTIRTESRIGLAASFLLAVVLWWLPLPASAVIQWINIELYVSSDGPDLSAYDPITVAQVGVQACNTGIESGLVGSCQGSYGTLDTLGVEFIVNNTATNLPSDLGGDAFLGGLYFASPAGLDTADFFLAEGTTQIAGFDVSGGTNAGYPYSWSVDFVNDGASGDRLLPGDSATWFIEGTTDTSVFLGEGAEGNANGKNKPPFLVMAHLQQVGPGAAGTCSLKYIGNTETIVTDPSDQNSPPADVSTAGACASVGVPEPSSVALLGIGLLLLGGTAAWRRRRVLLQTDR